MTNRKGDRTRRFAVTQADLDQLKGALRTANTFLAGRTYIELLDEKPEEAHVVSPLEHRDHNLQLHIIDLNCTRLC